MACQRNRIVEICNYLKSLGVDVNIGKNKARGNRGVFLGRGSEAFRIDIAKNIPEDNILPVLIHEFAHYVHYSYDFKLESLEFLCKDINDEMLDELINVTVDKIPKSAASELYNCKSTIQNEIKVLSEKIKASYPDFKLSAPYNKLERSFKFPLKYLLRYDKISLFKKIYSINSIEVDFPAVTAEQRLYIQLKSKQRALARINSRIAKLNRYYNRPAELFARFAELYFLEHEKAKETAPCFTGIMDKKLKDIPQFYRLREILSNVEFC